MGQGLATGRFGRLMWAGLAVAAVAVPQAWGQGTQAAEPAAGAAETGAEGSATGAPRMAETRPAAHPAAVVPRGGAAEEAAWAALQLLKDYVHAARLRDPDERAAKLPEVRRRMIEAAWISDTATPAGTEAVATLWPSVVAHYVDGFRRDSMVVEQPKVREAVATVVAINPQDQEIAEQLEAELRQELQKQGFSGQDLQARLGVLLRRGLAERGVGYPLPATIQVRLVNVRGTWKVQNVVLQAPSRAAVSRPVTRPVEQPSTQDASRKGQDER